MANTYSIKDIKDKFDGVYRSYFDFRETDDKAKEQDYLKSRKELEDMVSDYLNANIPNPSTAEEFLIDIAKDKKALDIILEGRYNIEKGNWSHVIGRVPSKKP